MTLTCNTTCILSNNPTFIWYKNGQPVTFKHTTRDNRLHLNPVSSEDVGSYSCAVRRHKSLFSTDMFLKVQCKLLQTGNKCVQVCTNVVQNVLHIKYIVSCCLCVGLYVLTASEITHINEMSSFVTSLLLVFIKIKLAHILTDKPKNVSVSISPGEIVEGVVQSLVR